MKFQLTILTNYRNVFKPSVVVQVNSNQKSLVTQNHGNDKPEYVIVLLRNCSVKKRHYLRLIIVTKISGL